MAIFLQFSTALLNKILSLKDVFIYFATTFQNEQDSVELLDLFSPMNTIVTNKIKYFPQLFLLDPQIH